MCISVCLEWFLGEAKRKCPHVLVPLPHLLQLSLGTLQSQTAQYCGIVLQSHFIRLGIKNK